MRERVERHRMSATETTKLPFELEPKATRARAIRGGEFEEGSRITTDVQNGDFTFGTEQ